MSSFEYEHEYEHEYEYEYEYPPDGDGMKLIHIHPRHNISPAVVSDALRCRNSVATIH